MSTPAPAGFASINGIQMYYEVTGDGEPLVFVHAGIADHRLWDDQVPFFSPKYKVVTFDMRGFGQSEPVDAEFTHRRDITALLDYLGIDSAHFVGCSMGGGFSMDIALESPERVKSLTMVCSGPGGLELEVEEPEIFAKIEEADQAGDLQMVAEYEAQAWFDGPTRTVDQVDPAKRAKAMAMNRIALEHEQKHLGKNVGRLAPAAAERLDELQIPVLVIVGEHDNAYIQAAGDYMVEHIANARKVMMADTAHLPSLEHPDEFNRILSEFLDGVS
jgi:pimeloyl-ACP methyl ester carboxylesterase